MNRTGTEDIIRGYLDYIGDKGFPCIAAKTALAKQQISCMVAAHLACPADDDSILKFLYDFVDQCRESENLYNSAAVIFRGPLESNEMMFDRLLWERLQALSDLDALNHSYDPRVSADPASPRFSFSIRGEAFYIIGLHPGSSRKARLFSSPVLVFNPHLQFQKLRETHKYEPMKKAVRQRDEKFSGSVNPMLADFGDHSEAFQYSGLHHDKDWQCPFISHHRDDEHHSTS